MYTNHMLMRIFDEIKKTNELLEAGIHPTFQADNIISGTLKADDVNGKLDRLSVLGTIDRYATEQIEERMLKAAQISRTSTQFKKFLSANQLWEEAKNESEQLLELIVRDKIKSVIKNLEEESESKSDAFEKLFIKYKQSEEV